MPNVPEDTTLIQIGFDHSLNYPFVVAHPLAAAQIFDYLPAGISYGVGIDPSNVTMRSIEPYQSQSAGFVISVALAYIPTDQVSILAALISTPTSQLYQNPRESVRSLMSLIDPTIPLIPGSSNSDLSGNSNQDGSGTSTASSPDPSSSNNSGGKSGLADSGSLDQPVAASSTVNTKTVGIAVGAVAGAAAYCGAIFLLTKHYRQKKRLALEGRESPELATGGPLSTGTYPASSMYAPSSLFTGAPHSPTSPHTLNSQTSARGPVPRGQISEPVMSENSLGWT